MSNYLIFYEDLYSKRGINCGTMNNSFQLENSIITYHNYPNKTIIKNIDTKKYIYYVEIDKLVTETKWFNLFFLLLINIYENDWIKTNKKI